MTTLKIKDKKSFVDNFLSSVSKLSEMCVLKIVDNNITCTLAAADTTIVCKAELPCDVSTEGETIILNIPDIKKLVRVLSIIPLQEIELKINKSANHISYNKGGYKFKYHVLNDGAIKLPNINVDKINALDFGCSFTVPEANLSTLFKGSAFTAETSKLYILSEGDKICGELGDRSRHNTDNFVCTLSEKCEGSAIQEPLVINFESFRLVSFGKSEDVKFRVNEDMGIVTCNLQKGDVSLIYIISALIN
tara:strand:- start:103 stop:849 length:747 start_codon:yes stop_codon:yes gene_type:complete